MYELKGMIAAMPTPFSDNEDISAEALSLLIEHLISGGLDGILVGGTLGEFVSMTMEERKILVKEACNISDGRVPVLAGSGTSTLRDTVELCKSAAEAGAAANVIISPYYYTNSQPQVCEYYRQVALKSPIPVIIYHYSQLTGIQLAPEAIYELSKESNIIGIKNTEDMDHTAKVISLTKDIESFGVATGYDTLIVSNFLEGGSACIGANQNVDPRRMASIYDAVKKKDFVKAAEINQKFMNLTFLMESEQYPGSLKAALSTLGIPVGEPRYPLTPASDELKRKLKVCLTEMNLI